MYTCIYNYISVSIYLERRRQHPPLVQPQQHAHEVRPPRLAQCVSLLSYQATEGRGREARGQPRVVRRSWHARRARTSSSSSSASASAASTAHGGIICCLGGGGGGGGGGGRRRAEEGGCVGKMCGEGVELGVEAVGGGVTAGERIARVHHLKKGKEREKEKSDLLATQG